MCGDSAISWTTFYFFILECGRKEYLSPPQDVKKSLSETHCCKLADFCRKTSYPASEFLSLLQLQDHFQEWQATEPRDLLFALRGIAHDGPNFRVDYSKDIATLLFRLTSFRKFEDRQLNFGFIEVPQISEEDYERAGIWQTGLSEASQLSTVRDPMGFDTTIVCRGSTDVFESLLTASEQGRHPCWQAIRGKSRLGSEARQQRKGVSFDPEEPYASGNGDHLDTITWKDIKNDLRTIEHNPEKFELGLSDYSYKVVFKIHQQPCPSPDSSAWKLFIYCPAELPVRIEDLPPQCVVRTAARVQDQEKKLARVRLLTFIRDTAKCHLAPIVNAYLIRD